MPLQVIWIRWSCRRSLWNLNASHLNIFASHLIYLQVHRKICWYQNWLLKVLSQDCQGHCITLSNYKALMKNGLFTSARVARCTGLYLLLLRSSIWLKHYLFSALFFSILHAAGHLVNFYHVGTQPIDHLHCMTKEMRFATDQRPGIDFWFFQVCTKFFNYDITMCSEQLVRKFRWSRKSIKLHNVEDHNLQKSKHSKPYTLDFTLQQCGIENLRLLNRLL